MDTTDKEEIKAMHEALGGVIKGWMEALTPDARKLLSMNDRIALVNALVCLMMAASEGDDG